MIIILGTPGAGKTTQCQLLADFLGCTWFSMGELIRQQATGKAKEEMLQGKIIDDNTTLEILSKVLADVDTANKECIVEGNPRSIAQANWWLEQIKAGRIKMTGIIYLAVSPEVAKDRLRKRGRFDDHDNEVIDKRFEEYRRSVEPTIAYLEEKGLPVHEVDANGTMEEVAQRMHKALNLNK